MGLTRITPVNITPLSTGWQTVDVASYCPPGTTGILYHYINGYNAVGFNFGIRKTGSTDTITKETAGLTHYYGAIGVSAGLSVDIYLNYLTSQSVYMVGYFDEDAVFFTNAVDKSLVTTGSPVIIDISADTGADTAIGAIFNVITTNYTATWFLRKYGSTDNRPIQVRYQCCAFIGVDGSEQCEGQISSTVIDFWLVGYIKAGATFNTNATDISLSTTGSYVDLPAIGANENAIIEVVSTSQSYDYALRKNGDSIDEYYGLPYHCWAIVEADASGLTEGKIENAANDFYLVGTFSAPSTTVAKEDELQFDIQEIGFLVAKEDELDFDIGINVAKEDTLKFNINEIVLIAKEDELKFDIHILIAKEDELWFDILAGLEVTGIGASTGEFEEDYGDKYGISTGSFDADYSFIITGEGASSGLIIQDISYIVDGLGASSGAVDYEFIAALVDYACYILNANKRTFQYSNYDFLGFGMFNQKLLGIKGTKIYDLTTVATHDHETDIDAYIEIQTDFGVPNRKGIRSIYLEDGQATVTITDEAGTAIANNISPDEFRALKRSLIDKSFTIKIQNIIGEQITLRRIHGKLNLLEIKGG